MNQRIREILERFRGKDPGLVGASFGFVIALLWMIFGFWKMLFILILTGLGYYLGARFFVDREELRHLLDRIFPPGRTR